MSRESSAKSFWWCWCGISPCSDNWWKHTVNYLSIMLLLFYNKCTHYILYLWWMQLSKQVSKQASSWIGPSSTPEIDTIKGFVSTNSCWNLWCCVLSIKCKTQCGIVEYSNRPHQLFNILWVSMRNIFHRDRILYVLRYWKICTGKHSTWFLRSISYKRIVYFVVDYCWYHCCYHHGVVLVQLSLTVLLLLLRLPLLPFQLENNKYRCKSTRF